MKMRLSYRIKWMFVSLVLLFLLYHVLKLRNNKTDETETKNVRDMSPFRETVSTIAPKETKDHAAKKTIYIAIVACGERFYETLNVMKSALMFTKCNIMFLLIVDEELFARLEEKMNDWKNANFSFNYDLFSLSFPKENEDEWRKLFKLCASQRLFLPSVLAKYDAVLYVDTDTLFLAPPERVWEHFENMNASQLAALTPEHEDANVGWYNRFARHPYYGPYGVNSGVMLMNLTRMRHFQWEKYVLPIYKMYKLEITWGDQDIINIIFHYHSEKLYIYPCEFNYRPDHCMHMSLCKSAEKNGVVVLHGSRGYFHSQKQPIFNSIFRAFLEYEMGGDKYNRFLLPLETYLDLTTDANCDKLKDVFLKNIREQIQAHADDF